MAGCRQLALLPSQILNVVQGNGPQGWLAAQSGFKHNLTRGKRGCVDSSRKGPPHPLRSPGPGWSASPETPQRWPPPPGLLATGAVGARPHPTRPAGLWHCPGAPSARPCLRAGPGWVRSLTQCRGAPGPLVPPPPGCHQPGPTHRSAQGSPCGTRSGGRTPQWQAEAGCAARPPGPLGPARPFQREQSDLEMREGGVGCQADLGEPAPMTPTGGL